MCTCGLVGIPALSIKHSIFETGHGAKVCPHVSLLRPFSSALCLTGKKKILALICTCMNFDRALQQAEDFDQIWQPAWNLFFISSLFYCSFFFFLRNAEAQSANLKLHRLQFVMSLIIVQENVWGSNTCFCVALQWLVRKCHWRTKSNGETVKKSTPLIFLNSKHRKADAYSCLFKLCASLHNLL